MPPAASRHAPVSAGRQAMGRAAMPPPAWRWMPAVGAVGAGGPRRAVVEAGRRGLGGAVLAGELNHFFDRDAASARGPFGGVLLDPLGELLGAKRGVRDVMAGGVAFFGQIR